MSASEITETLISFGLSPLQSACYVTLVREGKLPASTLAQIIAIDRSDVYRVLRSLRRLGMVEVELEAKGYYYAVPPEKALPALLDAKETELLDLKQKSKIVCELLENSRISKTNRPPTKDPFFRLVSGSQVFTRWGEAILNAKSRVVKVIPGYTVPAHFLRLSDIESEVSRRINVKIITEVSEQNLQTIRRYYEKIKILHAEGLTSGFRYLVIDDNEVFMGGTPMTSSIEDHVVIWTNNKVFVDACLKDFDTLLKRAEDPKAYLFSVQGNELVR